LTHERREAKMRRATRSCMIRELLDSGLPLERLWPPVAALFGLVLGSFANVCIHRLPRGESIVRPPSRCPACRALVQPWDNVPVLSFIALRGRCRACRAPISLRYPLVEAANAALYFLVAQVHGPTARSIALLALATALVVLTLIDLDHQILPDAITLPGIVVGVLASLLPGSAVSWQESIASAIGGYLVFAAVAFAWKRLRGIEALGQGDWKMAAMLGAFLGWQPLLLTVFLATLAGSLVGGVLIATGRGDRQSKLPLGSFLGLAALFALLWGAPVVAWYRGLFDA
jgi:leader peptidase (prepilin peptidase) / N-methyltransferase